MREYERYDALGLAELVATRQATPKELLAAALARIEQRNPRLNAVCRIAPEAARRAIEAGLPNGPFTGVPLLLKDLTAVATDLPMSLGSRFFADLTSTVDSAVVARLRRAGFVLLGRTTTPELGMSPTTEARLYGGPTRNPWNRERSGGGSSGGAGVAVAAGMVPLAHGGDGAGSLRIPASCCGLFGLKLTRARNPSGPLVGESWGGLAGDHVVSRSVRDSAAVLDATAGADPGAPYRAPPVCGSFLRALEVPVRRLRIAFLRTTFAGEPIDPHVAAAVDQAVRLLGALGHEVREDRPREVDCAAMLLAMVTVMGCGAGFMIDERVRQAGRLPEDDELEPSTRGAWEFARRTSGAEYVAALTTLHRTGRRTASFFAAYDMLLTPTLAAPPAPLGVYSMHKPDFLDYRLGPEGIGRYSPFTPLANVTGQPAMSVPLSWTPDGLPVGVHFVGRFGDERTLLQLARQLESAQPWFDRRPPGFAD